MNNTNMGNQFQNNHPKQGMAIASMVCGIVSIPLFCLWYISVPCAIVAIVLGVLAQREGESPMAKAGFITGIVGLGIVVVGWLFFASLFSGLMML